MQNKVSVTSCDGRKGPVPHQALCGGPTSKIGSEGLHTELPTDPNGERKTSCKMSYWVEDKNDSNSL